jgi:ribosomal protein L18E
MALAENYTAQARAADAARWNAVAATFAEPSADALRLQALAENYTAQARAADAARWTLLGEVYTTQAYTASSNQ